MPANKRAAPSTSEPILKKRKKKEEKKWYAVKVGVRPGVYETWPECQQLTAGYPGAQYKSFPTQDEAQAYMEGRTIPGTGDAPEKPRFYAVARGSFTGIYQNWDHAQKAIKGTKGPKYKRFETYNEAVAFIDLWGDEITKAKVRAEAPALEEAKEKKSQVRREPVFAGPTVFTQGKVFKENESNLPNIFTDGSSLGNGQEGAVAGVGVWFGPEDPRNISEPLEGEEQTNQRAELTAILRALQGTPPTEAVQIVTDSMYSINCITKWYSHWQDNDWITTEQKPVKNKDLVQAVREKIEEREAEGTRTDFAWVKGHCDTLGNVEADKLAVAGSRMGRAEAEVVVKKPRKRSKK